MQDDLEVSIKKDKPKSGDGNWAEDQAARGYYYDDSHGYEKFDPDADDDEEDEVPEDDAEN